MKRGTASVVPLLLWKKKDDAQLSSAFANAHGQCGSRALVGDNWHLDALHLPSLRCRKTTTVRPQLGQSNAMDMNMDIATQDLFVSHAGTDKEQYIRPLAEAMTRKKITFWLDSFEIGWGDSIPLRINDGLRKSRYVLLCLSRNYLDRSWPEAELSSALAVQNDTKQKRVLPLILNSKEQVLNAYPLLAQFAYKEYTVPDQVADDLFAVINPQQQSTNDLHLIVEGAHTGKLCNIYVSPKVSLRWLLDQAQRGMGVSEKAETGGYLPFRVRWVLVDTRSEDAWRMLPRSRKRGVSAVIFGSKGTVFCAGDRDRLEQLGVNDGSVFHLYAIEDEDYDPPVAYYAV